MSLLSANILGGFPRRSLLRGGAAALSGLFLPRMKSARAQVVDASAKRDDTAVIFVWLPGGPPQLDMYDMKPLAPSDYRGAFTPIPTVVPGLDVCEHLPLHAQVADRFCLIRSVSHEFADHGGGHKRFLTGRDPKSPVGFVNDYPAVGSIVAKMRERVGSGAPNYVAGMDAGREAIDTFSFGSAYLGPSYAPFSVAGDPSSAGFHVPNLAPLVELNGRLDDRRELLAGFDRFRRGLDLAHSDVALDRAQSQALDLVTSDATRRAFDLSLEPDSLRDRYGRHAWGQRALMARRLVEAGATFVTMVMENPYQSGVPFLKEGTYNWDSHAVNCHIFNDLLVRLPIYDRSVTALIEDIYARGLDRKVLLIVTGEFGRTPRLESQPGTQTGVRQPGRDHWPQSMSILVAGGGMRTGQVVGSTNSKGEYPHERPLTPNDLWATMYRHLNIDPRHEFADHHGRPLSILPYGDPIAELI